MSDSSNHLRGGGILAGTNDKAETVNQFKRFPMDFFAGTYHIETVCLLSNRKPDSYVHLNLKMEDYYRFKDAEKEQGKK